MNRKIVINNTNKNIQTAVLENDELVEFHIFDKNAKSILQNIYVGKVKNIVSGISAAFVDIGLDKNAYLKLDNNSTIKTGDEITVQVIKEPVQTKGAVVTLDISLPGKYMVITPFDKHVNLSRKITDIDERNRLLNIVHSNNESNMGYIIRTDAINQSQKNIVNEMKQLNDKWDTIHKYSKYKACYSLIYEDLSPLFKIVRELLKDSNCKLVINDIEQYDKLSKYLNENYDNLKTNIEYYNDKDWPIFNIYKIDSRLKRALQPKIWLKNGASIIIEQTEALVTIDVNSAKFLGKKNFGETIYKVNIEAAKEIAKQIRLRNLSGIIIIDFIDMEKEEYNEQLIEILKKALKSDRYKTSVLGMTRLGLIEMTRKKVQKSLFHQLSKKCSNCNGLGRIVEF